MLYMQVNGDDLVGVLGGEVVYINYFLGVGEFFILFLEFIKFMLGMLFRYDMDFCFGKSRICFIVDGLISQLVFMFRYFKCCILKLWSR